MSTPMTPADELPDRCEKCDSPMTLQRMGSPGTTLDDGPAEVPLCTNPECENSSPDRPETDVP